MAPETATEPVSSSSVAMVRRAPLTTQLAVPLTASLKASIHTHASELCQPRSSGIPAAAASLLGCCTRPSYHSASGLSCAALPPSAGTLVLGARLVRGQGAHEDR